MNGAAERPMVEERATAEVAIRAPSGYRVEQALSTWMSARARLLAEDTELEGDERLLKALLGDEEGEVNDILGRLLMAAQHAAAMAEGAEAMAKNLKARQARYEAREERLRDTLLAILIAIDEKRFEAAYGTAAVTRGRKSVIITDETKLEDRFVKVEIIRTPKKAELHTALTDGEVVEGAILSNGSLGLRVTSK